MMAQSPTKSPTRCKLPDIDFDQEYEHQKGKLAVFNDLLNLREEVELCEKELEDNHQIVAQHGAKSQRLELEFLAAATDFTNSKKKHRSHLDLWISRNVRTQDVVFMSQGDEADSLTEEKLESMIALAKLNALLLEEQLRLKQLPALKEKKKAELDVLNQIHEEAKRSIPELTDKLRDLRWACTEAENQWRERWQMEKSQLVTLPSRNASQLSWLSRQQNVHLAEINKLKNDNRLLEQDLRQLRNDDQRSEYTQSRQGLLLEEDEFNSEVGGSSTLTSGEGEHTGTDTTRSSQLIKAEPKKFEFGAALTDSEWIKDGFQGPQKTAWYIETYGRHPDFVWKALRCSSKRYLDLLDWHCAMKQMLSLGMFERSAFKKGFEEVFKATGFWTLGWIKEEWTVPQAMTDFIDSEEKGDRLYLWLGNEFNAAYRMHNQ